MFEPDPTQPIAFHKKIRPNQTQSMGGPNPWPSLPYPAPITDKICGVPFRVDPCCLGLQIEENLR